MHRVGLIGLRCISARKFLSLHFGNDRIRYQILFASPAVAVPLFGKCFLSLILLFWKSFFPQDFSEACVHAVPKCQNGPARVVKYREKLFLEHTTSLRD